MACGFKSRHRHQNILPKGQYFFDAVAFGLEKGGFAIGKTTTFRRTVVEPAGNERSEEIQYEYSRLCAADVAS